MMPTFDELLKIRRSVRDYADRPVPMDLIKTLITESTCAPNASNEQLWRFVIVSDKEYMRRISDESKKNILATIQVDLVMLPERFDLTYIDETGQPQRPIAIHRAIYGSLERFIGILVEHFAGAFPLWLAPVQAVVIPIADRHIDAAEEFAGVLRTRGLRVEVDVSDNRMQNKIRLAQEQKVPYMLVLGDREVEARTVAPRARNAQRGEQQEAVPWADLANRLAAADVRAGLLRLFHQDAQETGRADIGHRPQLGDGGPRSRNRCAGEGPRGAGRVRCATGSPGRPERVGVRS